MKDVYLIRKSLIDEESELARCSDFELAVSICKPGYKIYDQDGNFLYGTINNDRFGKSWNELKSKLEKEVLEFTSRLSMFPLVRKNELRKCVMLLNDTLKMMNKIEKEEE